MSYWIVAAFIFTAIAIAITKNLKKPKKNLPPGPRGLPLIGNLHQLGSLPHRTLFHLSKKYGPLMYLKLGSAPTVVASSPEAIREVLRTYDAECCTRPFLSGPGRLTYGQQDLVFSEYGEHWKELRKMSMHELYGSKQVQAFQYIREEEVATLVDFMKQAALSGTTVNFSNKMVGLSGSVVCRLGYGMHLATSKLKDQYEEVANDGMKVLGSFAFEDFFPYFGWIVDRLTGVYSRRERVFRTLEQFLDQAIDRHIEKKSEEGKEDMVDLLLKMEKEQIGLADFKLTRSRMKAILHNIIMAGTDTSAQTLVWVMTRLIANPRVMSKVQAEVRQHIKDKDNITEKDIEKMEYLKMAVKEAFRISSPVSLLVPRMATKDLKICGYDVPKNTRIQVNVWGLGHYPELWKDPEVYFPERFMEKDIDIKGQCYELIPFGSGRRICAGMGLATALVYLTLINLLYRFDWKLPDGMKPEDMDFEETYGLVLPKKNPLKVVPVVTQWT